MPDFNAFELIEPSNHNERLPRPKGMAEPKALIPEHLNDFAKKECKVRNMTASQYLGQLLAPAIEAEMKTSKTEKRRQLEELFGADWQEQVKEIVGYQEGA